jgi:hypothetical protein
MKGITPMIRRLRLLPALAFACLLLPSAPAAGQFAALLRRVPEHANAVLLLNLDAVKRSRLGVKEEWAAKHKENHLAGATNIPPNVQRLVIAAHVNPSTLHDEWKIAIAQFSKSINLAEIAGAEQGSVDKVAGQSVVLSPRNTYFVPFEPKVAGCMRPANRQELSRWLLFCKQNKDVALSPYLMSQLSTVGKENQILMAMDMEDVLDEGGVAFRLKSMRSLAGQNADMNELAKIISTLKGATLTIQVTDAINGELRIDFASPTEPLSKFAKPMLMEVMDRVGAHIADLEQWECRTSGTQIILSGTATETGVRQMLMPLLTPSARITSKPDGSYGQQMSQDPKATASVRYFKSVKTLLDDLQVQKVKTYKNMSYLLQKYAQSIDELPMLNVDEMLLKYGAGVSNTLRGLSSLALGTLDKNNFLEANKTEGFFNYNAAPYYGYGYNGAYGSGYAWGQGYYPGTGFASNYTQLGNEQGLGEMNERAVRGQAWNQINAATTQVRKAMTEKYQVEF